jgi:hypothetical protein
MTTDGGLRRARVDVTFESRPMPDSKQHQRYLTYLKKYEYFGQGRRKLAWDEFVALEAECSSTSTESTLLQRQRDVAALLLRD